jgi:hypothetical protein
MVLVQHRLRRRGAIARLAVGATLAALILTPKIDLGGDRLGEDAPANVVAATGSPVIASQG